jgi:hypothetical protein
MRPNGSDIAKALIDAGSAKALARLPRLLHPQEVSPLASFAFAIQRFSCAEWGAGTRKALVEAGVVDSLLAALRTSADIACPRVHIELALAVSSLGDVGGTSIRKEITKAGGIDILKQVGAASKPEVAKACDLAVKSITGNLWTRNAGTCHSSFGPRTSITVFVLFSFDEDGNGSQLEWWLSRVSTSVPGSSDGRLNPSYYIDEWILPHQQFA